MVVRTWRAAVKMEVVLRKTFIVGEARKQLARFLADSGVDAKAPCM